MQSKLGPIIDCNYSRARLRLLPLPLPHVSSKSSFPVSKSVLNSSDSIAMTCRKMRSYFSHSKKKLTPSTQTAAAQSASEATKDEEEKEEEDPKLNPTYSSSLWRRFWKVAAPYWSSEDRAQAQIQLAAVFALTIATTGISVGFNFLGRDFYNALANKDADQFRRQLLYYLGGFAVGIPFFVLRDYARETLSLRWRSWMTGYYMERYLTDRTFYKIQSQSIIDNPDQRIVDDLSSFTATALSFSLTLFSTFVDLISFSNILFGIYPPLFLVLLVYSIGGTAISIFLGKDLVTLNFMQEKKEADFRYGLVRVRENAESIAFYGGEDNELRLLLQRLRSALNNLTQLLIASRNLDFFTNGYRYLIQILPAAVIAPMYFSGKIEFGVINQSVSAFNHILGDFSLIVYQFQAISAFSAVIDRLGEFDDVLDTRSVKSASESSQERISLVYCGSVKDSSEFEANGAVANCSQKLLQIEDLTLLTPTNEATLIKDLSLQVNVNDHLLVTGPSGSGKTSLLRAMAGLWNTGRGKISFYVNDEESKCLQIHRKVFFLPQRPYMNLGTLRQQLLYPTWAVESKLCDQIQPPAREELPFLSLCGEVAVSDLPSTADLLQVLKDVRLEYIISRFDGIDSQQEWSSILSLGEQQRLAFARLLLAKPNLVLLDESTSALDEANESHLYQLIRRAGITYISIGHRRTLYDYHSNCLHITSDPIVQESGTTNCSIKPIPSNSLPPPSDDQLQSHL